MHEQSVVSPSPYFRLHLNKINYFQLSRLFLFLKTGEIFVVVRQLAELMTAVPSERVDHYLRWIRAEVHRIHRNPQEMVVRTCR